MLVTFLPVFALGYIHTNADNMFPRENERWRNFKESAVGPDVPMKGMRESPSDRNAQTRHPPAEDCQRSECAFFPPNIKE